ncbi:MAG: hypothetical protein WCI72_00585 [archaeon]
MGSKLIQYKGDFVTCSKKIAYAGQRIATTRDGMLDAFRRKATFQDKMTHASSCWYSEGTARIDGVNYWCSAEYAPTTRYTYKAREENEMGNFLALTPDLNVGNKPALEVIPRIAEEDKNKLPERRRVLIPEIQRNFSVTSTAFVYIDIARFLARDLTLAQDYGRLLSEYCGMKSIMFYQLSGRKDVAAGISLARLAAADSFLFDGHNSDFFDNENFMFGKQKDIVPEVITPTAEQSAIIEMVLKNRPKK